MLTDMPPDYRLGAITILGDGRLPSTKDKIMKKQKLDFEQKYNEIIEFDSYQYLDEYGYDIERIKEDGYGWLVESTDFETAIVDGKPRLKAKVRFINKKDALAQLAKGADVDKIVDAGDAASEILAARQEMGIQSKVFPLRGVK